MKRLSFLSISIIFFLSSCNSSVGNFFVKRTPHEAYANKIEKEPGGPEWLAASQSALIAPHHAGLPYRHNGSFPAGKSRALALKFTAKKGQRIDFDLLKKDGHNLVLFADLYQHKTGGASHLLAVDTNQSKFAIDIEETGDYILRIQPGLDRFGEYEVLASIAPSLSFPVAGSKARTGSYWGDKRDGGKRKHEGIDIFAAKRTPAIAAADGHITRVSEGGIGGKTVWMNVAGRAIHLYYAHLDTQWVEDGQVVKKGDTLGLVGNTGNARFTPSHLHFGVYGYDGPVDPFPYVDPDLRAAPPLKDKNLDGFLLPAKNMKSKKDNTQVADSLLVPLAVTSDGYLAENMAGQVVAVKFSSVKFIKRSEALATGKSELPVSGS